MVNTLVQHGSELGLIPDLGAILHNFTYFHNHYDLVEIWSLIPSHVKAMIYKIDTCGFLLSTRYY